LPMFGGINYLVHVCSGLKREEQSPGKGKMSKEGTVKKENCLGEKGGGGPYPSPEECNLGGRVGIAKKPK